MRNKLSFANMLFLMLLVGKIGELGRLGAIPWLLVILPLGLDVLLDYMTRAMVIDRLIDHVIAWIKIRQLKKIANIQNKRNG